MNSANYIENIESKLQPTQPNAKFNQCDLSDGSFAVEIKDIATTSGHKNAMVTVFSPNPKK